jgi:ribonuclease III
MKFNAFNRIRPLSITRLRRLLTSEINRLEQILQYTFRDPSWLDRALTHSSAMSEAHQLKTGDNEQLEFLGDAILGFCVSDHLFRNFPGWNEGDLSKIRSQLVSASNLFKVAQKLNLGDFLYLGHGEEKTGGRKKRTLQVDALEALIAAVYLDGGLEPARRFILACFELDFQELKQGTFHLQDFKSRLQERLQSMKISGGDYIVASQAGPEHEKVFTVEFQLDGKKISEGKGPSKKSAEQEAARMALQQEGFLPGPPNISP